MLSPLFASIFSIAIIAFGGFQTHSDARSSDTIVVPQAVVTLIDNIAIPAEEPGLVEAFAVKEGQQVDAGSVVAELNSEMHQLQLKIASGELHVARLSAQNEVELLYAEKSSEVSRKVLERSVQANQRSRRAVSKTEIERLELEFQRAELSGERAAMEKDIASASVAIREAEQQAAELRLRQRKVISPISGMVVERMAQVGEWVNTGQPLVRVIRLDRLKVRFFLDANSFDDSLVGNQVELKVAMPPNGETRTFEGVVTFVSPEVIPNREQIAVWAEIENPDFTLRPGSSGELRILIN